MPSIWQKTRLQAKRSPGSSSKIRRVALGVTLAVLVAAVLAFAVQRFRAEPTYALDPSTLLLSQADVGSQFVLLNTGGVGPAQQTVQPLPYQQQYIGGLVRTFYGVQVLDPATVKVLEDWSQQYGVPITDPPQVMGPFVSEHHGIFQIYSVVRSFQTVDAAWHEYHCCNYVGRADSFDDYHALSVPTHLGDESSAWTGIKKRLQGPGISPSMPTTDAYQERTYSVYWRHGPIVSIIAIWGSHDIALAQALQLAQIVDQHIGQALQPYSTHGGSHASHTHAAPPWVEVLVASDAALWAVDHRADADLRRR